MAIIAKQFVDVSTSALDDYKDIYDDYSQIMHLMTVVSAWNDLTNDQLNIVSDALDAAYDTHSNSDNYCGYSFDFVQDAIKHVNSLIK